MLQVPQQRLPCSLWKRPQWSRYFPVACAGSHGRAREYALTGTGDCGEPTLEQVYPEGQQFLGRKHHGTVPERLQTMGGRKEE